MSWKGSWMGNVYTGEHTFPDGTVFKGEARHVDKQTIVHSTPDGYTKVVEHEVDPHCQFTGTWEKDGQAGAPLLPPAPPPAPRSSPRE